MKTQMKEKNRIKNPLLLVLLGLCALLSQSCSNGQSVASPNQDLELSVLGEAQDFELTNRDESRVTLSDFRGKVVLITFIYASCPDDICLMQDFDLMAVRNGLNRASQEQLVLMSISFDPEIDTPQILKTYAEAKGFDIPNWYHLTGSQEEITKVTDEYGVSYELVPSEEETHADGTVHTHSRSFRHLSQVVIIDQEGMIRSQYLGIKIGEQVLPVENMLEDVKALLQP